MILIAKRDFNFIQLARQPSALGFEKGLFAGPAFEKRLALQLGRKSTHRRDFARREKSLGDFLELEVRFDVLDIDAELADAVDGEQCHFMGMGQIEINTARCQRRRQPGLAVAAKIEKKLRRVKL